MPNEWRNKTKLRLEDAHRQRRCSMLAHCERDKDGDSDSDRDKDDAAGEGKAFGCSNDSSSFFSSFSWSRMLCNFSYLMPISQSVRMSVITFFSLLLSSVRLSVRLSAQQVESLGHASPTRTWIQIEVFEYKIECLPAAAAQLFCAASVKWLTAAVKWLTAA